MIKALMALLQLKYRYRVTDANKRKIILRYRDDAPPFDLAHEQARRVIGFAWRVDAQGRAVARQL